MSKTTAEQLAEVEAAITAAQQGAEVEAFGRRVKRTNGGDLAALYRRRDQLQARLDREGRGGAFRRVSPR